jgi:uncharacterized protein (UPF0332 family)
VLKNQRIELSIYRLTKAEECIKAGNSLLSDSLYTHSVNRSYYAIFHTIRALLAMDGVDFKKHSAIIAYFQQHYIKTGIFERIYSDYAKSAFSIRTESDYEDFYVVTKKEAEEI